MFLSISVDQDELDILSRDGVLAWKKLEAVPTIRGDTITFLVGGFKKK